MTGLLLRNAEVDGAHVDIRVADDRIDEIAPALVGRGEPTVDVGGGAVIPGLHDHHIHLLALAAALGSVDVGPPVVRTRDELADALGSAPNGGPGSWVRAVGYHESVAGDLDREVLDLLVPDRPLRVQHRSGALWMLNSRALVAAGLDGPDDPRSLTDRFGEGGEPDGVERDDRGRLTGRFWRVDDWLRGRLPADGPPELDAVGAILLRHGVTGVTDATPSEDASALGLLSAAVGRGDLPQRVLATGGPGLVWPDVPGVEQGPVKILLPDHEDLSYAQMVAGVEAARAQGRCVAVHAVTAATAALVVAALESVGPQAGDRLEHGAVLSIELAARLAELGITVITNPGFVGTRGDQYLTDVDVDERPDLWRCRTLLASGVTLGAGTDAPFGDANPWRAIAAAVDRRTTGGRSLGPDEALAAGAAIDLFLGTPERPGGPSRQIRVGASADLCILDVPLAAARRDPGGVEPAATICRGQLSRWS